jgi:hypothetical protein
MARPLSPYAASPKIKIKAMKTFLILLTAIALFSAAPISAAMPTGNNAVTTLATDVQGVQSQLSRLLAISSNQITTMKGKVNFVIRLQENGRLEVLEIDGDVRYSVDQVRKVLENAKLFISPAMVGKSFRVGLQYGS